MPHRPSARCKNRDRLDAFACRRAIATAAMSTPAGSTLALPPDHSASFRLRRFVNWFPLGLTYAFLYMGRYNLTVAKNAFGDLMSNHAFGLIFAAGTGLYAFSFLINA